MQPKSSEILEEKDEKLPLELSDQPEVVAKDQTKDTSVSEQAQGDAMLNDPEILDETTEVNEAAVIIAPKKALEVPVVLEEAILKIASSPFITEDYEDELIITGHRFFKGACHPR